MNPDIIQTLRVDSTPPPITTGNIVDTVKVGRPSLWFRTSKSMPWDKCCLINDGGEFYLVSKGMSNDPLVKRYTLVPTISPEGSILLWALRVPNSNSDVWANSALRIAEEAKTKWVRVYTNREQGCYSHKVSDVAGEPTWPDMSMLDMLRIAFKTNRIKSEDHPIIRKLRGISCK